MGFDCAGTGPTSLVNCAEYTPFELLLFEIAVKRRSSGPEVQIAPPSAAPLLLIDELTIRALPRLYRKPPNSIGELV